MKKLDILPNKELFEWYMKHTKTHSAEELIGFIECFKSALILKGIERGTITPKGEE